MSGSVFYNVQERNVRMCSELNATYLHSRSSTIMISVDLGFAMLDDVDPSCCGCFHGPPCSHRRPV